MSTNTRNDKPKWESWFVRERPSEKRALFSIVERTRSSPLSHALRSQHRPHSASPAPAPELRRSNPHDLFPCDWLLCCPQRAGEEEERENMSQERQFNMTKPVPGEPLFSSPDPHEPLLFSPSPLIPLFPLLTFPPGSFTSTSAL